MNLSPLIGLILGIGILGASIALSGIPASTLIHPESLLMVFGGTLTAVVVGFSWRGMTQALGGFIHCLGQKRQNPSEYIQYFTEMALFIRSEGILSVRPLLDGIEMPLIRKGLELIMDNRKTEFIRDTLTTDMEVTYREGMDHARLFEAAGGYAPTMGIIGAVIGLIQTVNGFDNTAGLIHGIAGAFSATLWGVALANLFLLPIASKLRQQAKEDWFLKTILLEGVLSIQRGDHPIITEERLMAFIQSVGQPRWFGNKAITNIPMKSYSAVNANQRGDFALTSDDVHRVYSDSAGDVLVY